MVKLSDKIKTLPKKPGIYQFLDESDNVIYVGKANNLKIRVSSYFRQKNLGPKTIQMIEKSRDLKWIIVASEIEALLLEAKLIHDLKPKYNSILKDDKSHLYIKITNDEIPQVTTARREKPTKGVRLFGPFPSSRTVRSVLVTLRRIFPYCTHKKRPKSCLYVHLSLCPDPYKSQESKEVYKKNIKKIIKFLSGRKKGLIRDLIREMENLSKLEKYEEANKVKKQIEGLNYITQSVTKPEFYLEKPDLLEDIQMQTLEFVKKDLNLTVIPKRIECYDISNTGGKLATGSMVVFTNAIPDKSQYRRFRIIFKNKPNDVAMIKETLTRRLRNLWDKPDLIVIDGGRAQLNAAIEVIKGAKINVAVVSLAKRFEEVYIKNSKAPLRFGRDDSTLKLLQYLRDEAHRFAIKYHKKLRAKLFFNKE